MTYDDGVAAPQEKGGQLRPVFWFSRPSNWSELESCKVDHEAGTPLFIVADGRRMRGTGAHDGRMLK